MPGRGTHRLGGRSHHRSALLQRQETGGMRSTPREFRCVKRLSANHRTREMVKRPFCGGSESGGGVQVHGGFGSAKLFSQCYSGGCESPHTFIRPHGMYGQKREGPVGRLDCG